MALADAAAGLGHHLRHDLAAVVRWLAAASPGPVVIAAGRQPAGPVEPLSVLVRDKESRRCATPVRVRVDCRAATPASCSRR